MERLKRLISPAHLLFIAAVLVQFLPTKTKKPGDPMYAVKLLLLLEALFIVLTVLNQFRKNIKHRTVYSVLFLLSSVSGHCLQQNWSLFRKIFSKLLIL